MKTRLTAIALLLSAAALLAKPHTPEPGSAERKAICDTMREYVATANKKPLALTFLFKIEFLRVDNDYAGFEGFPVKPDGSLDSRFEDVVYTTFLKKQNGDWRVVRDLSRTDVPSAEEAKEIRRNFPADFPVSVMPEFWRKLLRP
jgi:hypothetical protein